MQAFASTLPYEYALLDGGAVPRKALGRLTVPTLVMDGSTSDAWALETDAQVVAAIPGARADARVSAAALVPVLCPFLRSAE